MSERSDQKAPEILLQIQAAEQEVEQMVRAARQEATTILDRARAQAEILLVEKRRSLEQMRSDMEATGMAEARWEAEQLLKAAATKAHDVKARCMGRMDEAVQVVLKRILPERCDKAGDR